MPNGAISQIVIKSAIFPADASFQVHRLHCLIYIFILALPDYPLVSQICQPGQLARSPGYEGTFFHVHIFHFIAFSAENFVIFDVFFWLNMLNST